MEVSAAGFSTISTLVVFLICSPTSLPFSTLPQFVRSAQPQRRCHSQLMLCRSLKKCTAKSQVQNSMRSSTQIWGSPFVWLPMWVSGSQQSSQKVGRWMNFCSPNVGKQTVCPLSLQQYGYRCDQTEFCQYVLMFCSAEKQRLDILPHCLDNNFNTL